MTQRVFVWLLAVAASGTIAVAQQLGSVTSDSSHVDGILYNQGTFANNRKVRFAASLRAEVKEFRPADIKEYAFRDGDRYVSFAVQEAGKSVNYFLLQVIPGASLYVLKTTSGYRTFALKEGMLVEFEDGSFQTTLSAALTGCNGFETSLPLVKNNLKSLSHAYRLHARCYTGHYPTLRKGLVAAFGLTQMTVIDVRGTAVELKPYMGLQAGGFLDFGSVFAPAWSINVQALFQRSNYTGSKDYYNASTFTTTEQDIDVGVTSVTVPVLVRWKTQGHKIRLFANAGPALSLGLKVTDQVRVTSKNPTTNNSTVRELGTVSPNVGQAILGAGFDFSPSVKSSIGVELRWTTGAGLGLSENQKVSALQLIAVFAF